MPITGTNQIEKHMEVLRILNKYVQDGVKVLFRINGADNIDVYSTINLNERS